MITPATSTPPPTLAAGAAAVNGMSGGLRPDAPPPDARATARASSPRSASSRRPRGGRPARRSSGASPGRRPVRGMPLRCRPQFDQVHRLTGVELQHEPHLVRERHRIRRLRRETADASASCSAADRSMAASNDGRLSREVDRLGTRVTVTGRQRLPFDRQHPMALEIAKRAVVGEHVEPVLQIVRAPGRACAGGCVRSPTYARTTAMRSSDVIARTRASICVSGTCVYWYSIDATSLTSPSGSKSTRRTRRVVGSVPARAAARREQPLGQLLHRGARRREVRAPRHAAVIEIDALEERRDHLAQLARA